MFVVRGAGTAQPQEPQQSGPKGGGTDCAPPLAHHPKLGMSVKTDETESKIG